MTEDSTTLPPHSDSVPGAPLEAVLRTEELDERPSRTPNRALEDMAINSLMHGLNGSPETILQSLAETILSTLQCDSAGVSLMNEETQRFEWPAIAGIWQPHIGGGTPRGFGPCGDVLDRNAALLFKRLQLRYTYFNLVASVNEALLVPFYSEGKAVGTIWAVTHEPPNNLHSQDRATGASFDREDLRMLESLGRFAERAYDVWSKLDRATASPSHC